MGNISALVLMCLSFLCPLLSPQIRRNRTLFLVCIAILFFHNLASIWNAFLTPLSTTWGDLYRFHNIGAGLDPEFQPYGELLKIAYRFLGVSFWLGETLSNLAFALSLALFAEMVCLLAGRTHIAPCLLVYGLLPSTVIHFSVTFREVYQSTGLLGATYAILLLRSRPNAWTWPLLILSLLTLVFMHSGLAVIALLMVVAGVPWALQGRGSIGGIVAILLLIGSPIYAPKLADVVSEHSAAITQYEKGNLFAYAAHYREGVAIARSDYGIKIETDGIDSFLSSAFMVVLMYFFAPLPWQVTSTIDYYAFFEVVLRTALILGALKRLTLLKGEERARNAFVMAIAIAVELLWSIGTSNWGTAIRHHGVAYTLLVAVGLPYFPNPFASQKDSQLEKRRRQRKLPQSAAPNPSSTAFDPIVLVKMVRSYGRLALFLTLLTALPIGYFTWPVSAPTTPQIDAPFLSSGSLLLGQGKTLEMFGTRSSRQGLSDLSLWLSENQLFEKLLSRQRVLEKIQAAVQKKRPELAPYARSVVFIPGYGLESQRQDSYQLYHQNNDIVDYAQLDYEDVDNFQARRATRISVQASATTPADAEFLADVALSVMQEVLQDVATKRARAQRRVIEGYIQLGQRRTRRAEQTLRSLPEASTQSLAELETHRANIVLEIKDLEREVEDLKMQIRHLGTDALQSEREQDQAIHEKVRELKSSEAMAQRLYMPDNLVLTELQTRLRYYESFQQKLKMEREQQAVASLQASLIAKERMLRLCRQELAELEHRRPGSSAQLRFQKKEKELLAWQEELLQWQSKLIQARIEEKLCEGDGTSTVLSKPLLGERSLQAVRTFWETYKKPFTLIPLSALSGFLTFAIAFLLKYTQGESQRAVAAFDAPVICQFPTGFVRHQA